MSKEDLKLKGLELREVNKGEEIEENRSPKNRMEKLLNGRNLVGLFDGSGRLWITLTKDLDLFELDVEAGDISVLKKEDGSLSDNFLLVSQSPNGDGFQKDTYRMGTIGDEKKVVLIPEETTIENSNGLKVIKYSSNGSKETEENSSVEGNLLSINQYNNDEVLTCRKIYREIGTVEIVQNYKDGIMAKEDVFDGDGDLIKKRIFSKDGKLEDYIEYTRGRATLQKTFHPNGEISSEYREGKYETFYENGKVNESLSHIESSRGLISKFSYYESGKIKSQEIYQCEDSMLENIKRRISGQEYSEDGRVKSVLFGYAKDDYQYIENTRNFDDNGTMREDLRYTYDGYDKTIKSFYQAKYDASGNKSSVKEVDEDNNLKFTCYDKNGRKTTELKTENQKTINIEYQENGLFGKLSLKNEAKGEIATHDGVEYEDFIEAIYNEEGKIDTISIDGSEFDKDVFGKNSTLEEALKKISDNRRNTGDTLDLINHNEYVKNPKVGR